MIKMKKIKVIKALKYKNCPIYIRRLDTRFEYLIIYRRKLYTEYVDIKPVWYRRWLFNDDDEKLYNEKQLGNIAGLLYRMACKTIDKIKK